MKKLLPYLIVVVLASALVVTLWTNRATRPGRPIVGTIVPASNSDEISASRTNAIVLASRKVSPAVVSVVVTQTRVVTYDPFGGLGFDEFFRDFFPRRAYRQEVKSMGSGVIISADGDVITNAHVVLNATRIKVTLPDNREFAAELEGLDETRDLALLKLKAKDLPAAALGNSNDLMIGEWSIAIGNPFGFMLEDAQPTVTVGVVSALHRDIKSSGGGQVYADMIQTDAAINPGNSGGALVNAAGEVIGINTFIFSHSGGSEGIGFARPINDVKQFVSEARGAASATNSERRETGLDVAVADINPLLQSNFGLGYRRGVVVVEVEAGGIGETIGMAPGDVIRMAQGKTVNSASAFARLYEHLTGTIDIVIDRGGEQIRLLYRLR
ncbi:trypsin-like peptidase domain-containing protein [candidate division WOR-3 bacterium]|nr:trypsin-like peptidase domain-containing protein [candidate division WOR-3 bacterium]